MASLFVQWPSRTLNKHQLSHAHVLICQILQHESQPFAINDEEGSLENLPQREAQANTAGIHHIAEQSDEQFPW